MGQKTSKHHAPLTFAYILKEDEKANEDILFEPQEAMSDFVLANPHLYKLDVSCKSCSNIHGTADNGSSDLPDSRIAISDVSEECPHCKKNKRLSLVKRHLVDDLAYIDETYYPDISHYNSKKERVENEIIRLEEDNEEWAKLTIADVTQKRRRSRKLNEPKVSVNLSGRSLVKLSPSIGFLDNLTSLNLSHNQMTSLPLELGYLKNLRVLNASSNQLESIPDTIAFLSKLKALNIGHNKLTSLPRFIGVLPKLLILLVHNNSLKEIPREMANLRRLVCLSISDNPLESIPAEIATVTTLQKLIAERCSFKTEFNHDLVSSPPSLFELCARAAIREALDIPIHLPAHIKRYLGKAQSCSYCHGPYIESHVVCGRFIERSRQQIALEYRLCSPHWNTEDERILNIFSNPPFTLREVENKRSAINMDGLSHTSPSSLSTRHRANSDGSRSLSQLMSLNPSTSSQLSHNSNVSSANSASQPDSLSDITDSISYLIPIHSLKQQPILPDLPTLSPKSILNPSHHISSLHRPGQRARSSSNTSVTQRFAKLLSPSNALMRSRSSSSLRQQASRQDTRNRSLEETHDSPMNQECYNIHTFKDIPEPVSLDDINDLRVHE